MGSTVTLSASAKYGYGGKQFVARITGRDSKYTFEREFLGRKEGKRGDYTETMVDGAGLYVERDIDRKGNADETYYLLWEETAGDVRKITIPKEDAMTMAKWLDEGKSVDWRRESLDYRIDLQRKYIAESEGKDADEEITLKGAVGSLPAGATVKRSQLVEERRQLIEKWERELKPAPAGESDERATAIGQIRELMSRHNITATDLG